MEDLSNDELMDFFDEWLMEGSFGDDKLEKAFWAAAEAGADFEQISEMLEAVNLYSDFEDYVEEELAERGEE